MISLGKFVVAPLLLAAFCPNLWSQKAVRSPQTRDEAKLVAKYSLDRFGQRQVGRGVNMYSPREEMELGMELTDEVERTAKFIKDEQIVKYVEQLGARLAAHSESSQPLRFKVIDSDEVNAFSLPNGMVYVNSGLLLMADNEAELAGVLSHEIGHVAAHHGVRTATKRQLIGLGNLAVMMFTGGVTAMVAQPTVGVGSQMLSFKFERSAEFEADLLGVEYSYLSGYDPNAFIALMERIGRMDNASRGRMQRMFATHPEAEERIRRTQRNIELLLPAREDYMIDSNDFQAMRRHLASLQQRVVDDEDLPRPVLRHVEQFYASNVFKR